jgi:hypothetical protein
MDHLELAKLLGEPISTQLPVPFEIMEIADFDTAEPGEKVFRWINLDTLADVILDADPTNGVVKVIKRTPGSDVELTFKALDSKLEYVLIHDILNSPDQNKLASRSESIGRGMDKREFKLVLDAMLTPTSDYYPANKVANLNDAAAVSTDTIYDVIMRKKQLLNRYGDNFVILAGINVVDAIENFDKDQAANYNYNLTLEATLAQKKIKIVPVFGTVSMSEDETEVDLLDADTFIMVAINSRIAKGKPVHFVRRMINGAMPAQAGLTVDQKQRAVIVDQALSTIKVAGSSERVKGYGVMGFEEIIFCIKNPYAIATCDCSIIL